jgi:hypothetical protein
MQVKKIKISLRNPLPNSGKSEWAKEYSRDCAVVWDGERLAGID